MTAASVDGFETTDLRGHAVAGLEAAEIERRLTEAVAAVRAGRALVYPTETVYGVGSRVSPDGVRTVLAAKRRPADKPLSVLVDGVEGASSLEWTPAARELAATFWPGALTLVLNDPDATFPDGVRSASGTVAIRHTPHPVAAAIVRALGAPLTSSSANRPGEPPATDSESARRFAEELAASGLERPHLVDVGRLPPSAASTLIDCTVDPPRVIREGSVPSNRIRCLLPDLA